MTTIVWSPPSVSAYVCDTGDASWSSPTNITLGPNQSSCGRNFSPGSALDALHDGCIVSNIRVEFTASKSGFGVNVSAGASFMGVGPGTTNLTNSSTLYLADGGAGALPSAIRAGTMASSCRTFDDYSETVGMSIPIVTITYIDNGLPSMMQFSL